MSDELQDVYVTSQSAVVDRISGISEILEDDPFRMLRIIADRLFRKFDLPGRVNE